jgi:RNA polymerase sigma-70 factor, ECF subfamily
VDSGREGILKHAGAPPVSLDEGTRRGRGRPPGDRMDDAWKEAASAAMDRYACGEDPAFSELYDLLAPRLASFLMRRTRDEAKTDDLVQQTFLQMHCARRHFTRGASVTAWAYAIARRILIDTYRKSGRETLADASDDGQDERASVPSGQMPDRIVANNRLARRLEQELARVPETNRAAFELVHRDGLTAAEAAEVLGTTSMAVRLRVHRAYEALRAVLGDQVREELGELP